MYINVSKDKKIYVCENYTLSDKTCSYCGKTIKGGKQYFWGGSNYRDCCSVAHVKQLNK